MEGVRRRLVLRRALKPRYPGPWKPGGKTLDEWVAVSRHPMRVSDMAVGQHFVAGGRVYRKVGNYSVVRLEEDTSEVNVVHTAQSIGFVDPRSLDDFVIGRAGTV